MPSSSATARDVGIGVDHTTASPLFDIAGKRVLVTGGTRGIGSGIVRQLIAAGARVAFCSEDAEGVARARGMFGDALGFVCDVRDDAALAELVTAIKSNFDGLDALVCNAGITGTPGGFADLEMADYDRVMSINLRSIVVLAKLMRPLLQSAGGGSIVLMASLSALRGNNAISSYALAKAGVTQLARNLAVEWGPDNIRTNAIAPGLIRTELSGPLLANQEFMGRRMQMTPMRRVGEIDEIAGAVHYLLAPAGSFVNGHTLVIDGGTLITDGS